MREAPGELITEISDGSSFSALEYRSFSLSVAPVTNLPMSR